MGLEISNECKKKLVLRDARRKHIKLWGGEQHFDGTFFFKKEGHFLKIKSAFLFIGKSCVPLVPASMVVLSSRKLRNSTRSPSD